MQRARRRKRCGGRREVRPRPRLTIIGDDRDPRLL